MKIFLLLVVATVAFASHRITEQEFQDYFRMPEGIVYCGDGILSFPMMPRRYQQLLQKDSTGRKEN